MNKILIIFCFLPSLGINAQNIDYSNFNEGKADEVMFNRMNEYTLFHGGDSLTQTIIGQDKIYKCLRKKSYRLSLIDLSNFVNEKIMGRYDTPHFLSVCLLDSISCKDINTYQELSDRCITDLESYPINWLFMMGWGNNIGVVSYFNIKSSTIYIAVSYLP